MILFVTGIEVPTERQRLSFMDKVPATSPGMKPLKMMKRLELIRGEEEVHTDFIHEQYGIVALRGGFLRHGHLEMIRLGISRRINTKKMFAIWRVESPWKPHSKKGQGKRMGGGKGSNSYYTTPVKAKRVLIEVAGKCTFEEVKPMLDIIAHKLPFPAAVMSQQMIEEQRKEDERLEKENINRYTFKYILQNNLLGSKMWARKKTDLKYFGKYV
ncbi:UNVERIFIED_CONTAM: hypothetical protein GTU68_049734 [Idotea baltica]|nr:hypothetical protein [Idotea baltica]